MIDLLEVEFKGNRKVIYSNPEEVQLQLGDFVVVNVEKGKDMGEVVNLGRLVALKSIDYSPKSMVRKSSESEIHELSKVRLDEDAAGIFCKQKVADLSLAMKIVDVEMQYDRSKMVFYFTSDGRVDFRELVKQLAAKYKTRIELKQIGVRDEARRVKGCGKCGRTLCCSSHIKEFEPITTQYAKDQNLPLNPGKLSGVCGRLMCCLSYERDYYQETLKKFPTLDARIRVNNKNASVIKIDVFNQALTIRTVADEYIEMSLDEFNEMIAEQKLEHDKKHHPEKTEK